MISTCPYCEAKVSWDGGGGDVSLKCGQCGSLFNPIKENRRVERPPRRAVTRPEFFTSRERVWFETMKITWPQMSAVYGAAYADTVLKLFDEKFPASLEREKANQPQPNDVVKPGEEV